MFLKRKEQFPIFLLLVGGNKDIYFLGRFLLRTFWKLHVGFDGEVSNDIELSHKICLSKFLAVGSVYLNLKYCSKYLIRETNWNVKICHLLIKNCVVSSIWFSVLLLFQSYKPLIQCIYKRANVQMVNAFAPFADKITIKRTFGFLQKLLNK